MAIELHRSVRVVPMAYCGQYGTIVEVEKVLELAAQGDSATAGSQLTQRGIGESSHMCM
jgi:hypothetical protein